MVTDPNATRSPYEQAVPHRFGTNDLLFNLALLNAVAGGVFFWSLGAGIGTAIMGGLGVFVLGMPVILSLTYLLLRPTGSQGYYLTWTNGILVLTLLALIILTVHNLV